MNKKLIKALSALTGAGMMGTAGTLHTFAADAAGDMNAAGADLNQVELSRGLKPRDAETEKLEE